MTGGIDLLDGSRPISRPVTSVIAIVDPLASRPPTTSPDSAPMPYATFAFATVRNGLLRVMCALRGREQRVEQTSRP